MMETLTCILKYVLLGDSGTGKSSLLVRLTDDRFSPAGIEPTLGVEFGSRVVEIKGGRRVKVQCWDTAGTESFRSITRSYFRGAAGAFLVYDVTRRETFDHVSTWLEDLRAYADEDVSIILIANKTDLCNSNPPPSSYPSPSTSSATSHDAPTPSPLTPSAPQAEPPTHAPPEHDLLPRQVSTAEGLSFAETNGIMYLETSAKEGWNVVQAFERTAVEAIRRKGRKERGRGEKTKNVQLGQSSEEVKGGCC